MNIHAIYKVNQKNPLIDVDSIKSTSSERDIYFLFPIVNTWNNG